jgi:hypothetical protein
MCLESLNVRAINVIELDTDELPCFEVTTLATSNLRCGPGHWLRPDELVVFGSISIKLPTIKGIEK